MSWFRDRARAFPDRTEAGRRLAEAVRSALDGLGPAPEPLEPGPDRVPATGSSDSSAIVLGIPGGGVPVAAGVADALGLPLDVVVAHKVGAPYQPELAVGAVAADGTVVLEPWANAVPGTGERDLGAAVREEIDRARAREERLRGGRPGPRLAGRTVIVVDDGIATGATMRAAVLAARAAGAARIVVASPVAAPDSLHEMRDIADAVVALLTPSDFRAVGEWYDSFDQLSDADVAALLATRRGPG